MNALLKIGIAILATQMICGVVQAQSQQPVAVIPMHGRADGLIGVSVTMNGKRVDALLDTGANMAVVSKKIGLHNVQFNSASVLDFHGGSAHVVQGEVQICVADNVCTTVDGIENPHAQDNIVPLSVLQELGSHVELDFHAKTITILK